MQLQSHIMKYLARTNDTNSRLNIDRKGDAQHEYAELSHEVVGAGDGSADSSTCVHAECSWHDDTRSARLASRSSALQLQQ